MNSRTDGVVIQSSVNESHAYQEIILNKALPLEILREAISNGHDYQASTMEIYAKMQTIKGKRKLVITISDDGAGMDIEGLRRFAGLGYSESYEIKQNEDVLTNRVGEKGHGTLLYFYSEKVTVETKKDGKWYTITWDNPWELVSESKKLKATPLIQDCSTTSHGTKVTIIGYGENDSSPFAHHKMKDYIQWFTKFGSFENQFFETVEQSTLKVIKLQGVDRQHSEPDMIFFGHPFPKETRTLDKLFEEHLQEAPKRYCQRIMKSGTLERFPEYQWHCVISLEGDYLKRDFNPCIGKKKTNGLYNVQERYGLWLCKDFIPIMRKNDWITTKGSEFTRYHAFFNCQAFKLTANRGSVESTESSILQDIEKVIRDIRAEIEESEEWENWDWLEGQASGEKTRQREATDWKRRLERVKKKRYAEYKGNILLEPSQEGGVYALLTQLLMIDKTLFPFEVIDYDTHSGIDLIVRSQTDLSLTKKYDYKYLELKHLLKEGFNHCFKYMYAIVCWKIDDKVLLLGETVTDALGEERRLVEQRQPNDNVTHYYLEKTNDPYRIPVFVLERYLKEKLDISFNKQRKLS